MRLDGVSVDAMTTAHRLGRSPRSIRKTLHLPLRARRGGESDNHCAFAERDLLSSWLRPAGAAPVEQVTGDLDTHSGAAVIPY